MHGTARTANLLGAVALAVTDLAQAGTGRVAGVSASGAAALVVLSASPEVSVTDLGRRVGLTQSAAARMVDSLEAGGLVRRRRGYGRQVPVRLTPAGRQTVRRLLAARRDRLTEAFAVLDDEEQARLADLLARLLEGLYEEIGDSERMCRLCDRRVCTAGAVCPVGQAERERAHP